VDWYDETGRRCERTLTTKREAEKLRAEKALAPGRDDARRLEQALEAFLEQFEALAEAGERRRSTFEQKAQHLRIHVRADPVARLRMSAIGAPELQGFYDRLIEGGVSYALARKIQATVRQLFRWAAVRGWPVRAGAEAAAVSAPRSKRLARPAEIPPKAQCRAILDAAEAMAPADRGRARAAIRLMMLSGPRPGELRALRWSDLQLDAPAVMRVRRSADKYGEIHDRPKTDAGNRDVPISPDTALALKKWRLACPPGPEDLVFPNAKGKLWSHEGVNRGLWTAVLREAGLADSRKGPVRKHRRGAHAPTVWTPRWPMKAARHVAASAWIANGASQKWIKEKMGHATIKLSQDLYGHLWPDQEADARLAAAADRSFD
jgi:integrase